MLTVLNMEVSHLWVLTPIRWYSVKIVSAKPAASFFTVEDSPSSKMKAVRFSETLATIYQTTPRHIPRENNP
jgi:hypothetical protein